MKKKTVPKSSLIECVFRDSSVIRRLDSATLSNVLRMRLESSPAAVARVGQRRSTAGWFFPASVRTLIEICSIPKGEKSHGAS